MHAVRNIDLCTKDCLCLYVCPTGATDTETGQIDAEKCISGCRICVDACPSHALSLVPEEYPPQQDKAEQVSGPLLAQAEKKLIQEQIAAGIAAIAQDPVQIQLAESLEKSFRLLAEDLIREAGFMLPQSENVKGLLTKLLEEESPEGFPEDVVKRLLNIL